MLEAWLDNPLFQSAIAPFAIALVLALLLRPLGGWAAGLGFAVAFYTAVWLIVGFQFTPLTSTRKLLLAGAVAVAVGLIIEVVFDRRSTLRPWLLGTAAAAVALWILWPLASRREGAELWLMVIPALAYTAWLTGSIDTLRDRPVSMVVACLGIALGTGVSAVFGASALLGQLGGAIAAAIAAYAVVFLIIGEFGPRGGFSLPASLLCALIGIASVVYASLPWYSLLPLTLIPLLACLPVPRGWGIFGRGLLTSIYVLPPAVVSIVITWQVAGAPPL